MKRQIIKIILLILVSFNSGISFSQGIIIDHNCTSLGSIPQSAIENAKQTLNIAYEHTSHGSQLITGMTALIGQTNLNGYQGDIYQWNETGNNNALIIDDEFTGSSDLGHYDDTSWAAPTRTYLNNHSTVNVVMWSWCGGVSDNSTEGIQAYLDKMNELEQQYPNVTFVYMTGHADIWEDATLKANNQQIRDYCIANNKVLYDFYDIESYDPDGNYYEFINDDCAYYSDGTGNNELGNWATEWQNSHTEGVDWYDCSPAHTQALNGNLKAYAAWWLFARIAGWDGNITSSKQIIKDNIFNIYPNPATDNVQITMNNEQLCSNIQILDITGKTVSTFEKSETYQKIDISNLHKGLYFVNIGNLTKKLIVE